MGQIYKMMYKLLCLMCVVAIGLGQLAFGQAEAAKKASHSTIKTHAPVKHTVPVKKTVVHTSVANKLSVSASTVSLKSGQTKVIHLYVTDKNGKKKDVSSLASWYSNHSSVAKVSKGKIRGGKSGVATVTATYAKKKISISVKIGNAAPARTLTVLKIMPSAVFVPTGQSKFITATAVYSDKTEGNVTDSPSINWSTDNPDIASVTAGKISGIGSGSATITARYGGKSASTIVTVSDSVSSIVLSSTSATLAAGQSSSVYLNAINSNNTRTDVTRQAVWSSANSNIVSVDAGKITAVGAGTTTIAAIYNGESAAMTVWVTARTLDSLSISPGSMNLGIDDSDNFALTAVYSDGSRENVASSASWISSKDSIASVSSAGKVYGNDLGSANITASYGGKSATSTVYVSQSSPVTSLNISPGSLNLSNGDYKYLTATASYKNGKSSDVTSSVSWRSNNTNVVSISSSGRVTANGSGNATIYANLGGVSDSISVYVSNGNLNNFYISNSNLTLSLGQNNSAYLTAVAQYSDNKSDTITSQASWSSSNTSVVSVNSSGRVTANAVGTAVITATYQGRRDSVSITVTGGQPDQLSLSSSNIQLTVGHPLSITASAVYPDGRTVNITSASGVQWISSNQNVVTVNAGKLTPVSAGGAIITVRYMDYTAFTTVSVKDRTVTTVKVAPETMEIQTGEKGWLALTAAYSDNTQEPVLSNTNITWTSSNESVASVDKNGMIIGISSGTAQITASYKGQSAICTVKVS